MSRSGWSFAFDAMQPQRCICILQVAQLCEGYSLVGTDNADDVLQAAPVGSQGRGRSCLAKLFGLDEADADEAGAHADVVLPPISSLPW